MWGGGGGKVQRDYQFSSLNNLTMFIYCIYICIFFRKPFPKKTKKRCRGSASSTKSRVKVKGMYGVQSNGAAVHTHILKILIGRGYIASYHSGYWKEEEEKGRGSPLSDLWVLTSGYFVVHIVDYDECY